MKKYYSPASQRRNKLWLSLGEKDEPVVNTMFYVGTTSQREMAMTLRHTLLVKQEQVYEKALQKFKLAGNVLGIAKATEELKRIRDKRAEYWKLLEEVS